MEVTQACEDIQIHILLVTSSDMSCEPKGKNKRSLHLLSFFFYCKIIEYSDNFNFKDFYL